MVLVSIHPFAFRKIFLLALAILGLSSALCFADPVFMTRQYAPSRDQTRPARMAMASRANLEGHSLILSSFDSSLVTQLDLSVVRALDPFGGRMGSVFLVESAPAAWETPISWHSDIDSTLGSVGLSGVRRGL